MDIEAAEAVAAIMAQSGAKTLGDGLASSALEGVRSLYAFLRQRLSTDTDALRELELARATSDDQSVASLAESLVARAQLDPTFGEELAQRVERLRAAHPALFAVQIAGDARVGKVINIDAPHGHIEIG